jgi:chromosome segregation ATPase
MVRAYEDQAISGVVDNYKGQYYTINVDDAMRGLTQVGQLLQVAYAGSKGYKCNAQIVQVLSRYQTLVKDTFFTSSVFVGACLSSLKVHRLALRHVVERHDTNKAIEVLSGCEEMAGKMATASGELVEKAKWLCDKSEEGLVSATEDSAVEHDRRRKVQKEMHEFQAQRESLQVRVRTLNDHIEQARQEEKAAIERAERAQTRAMIVGIVGAVMSPLSGAASILGSSAAPAAAAAVGGPAAGAAAESLRRMVEQAQKAAAEKEQILKRTQDELQAKKRELEIERQKPDNQAKIAELEGCIGRLEVEVPNLAASAGQAQQSLQRLQDDFREIARQNQEREAAIAQERRSLQKELRDADSKLAEAVQRLKDFTTEKAEIDAAIASLDVVCKTLGKVKTVFENARLFWLGVQRHCRDLSQLRLRDAADFEDELIQAIENSGYSWLALGKINYIARKGIASVNGAVDKIMENLPDKSEAPKLIENAMRELTVLINQQ